MNFLAKTIGSLTGSSIPYNFGERIQASCSTDPNRSFSIWNVYHGTSNKDNLPVTIFEFELKTPQNSKFTQLARNAYKKLRSLSLLPGVLTVVDSIENDNYLYLITERVTPLIQVVENYYEGVDKEEVILWGIYQIACALKLINVEGASIHSNVCLSSIFITVSGEWRLGGFELLTNYKEADYAILNMAYQLPAFNSTLVPPEFQNNGANFFRTAKSNQAIKVDAFKLGVLAYQLFTCKYSALPLAEIQSNLNNLKKIPLNKLLNHSVGIRYSVEQFLKNGENSYFSDPGILSYISLSEITLKGLTEKVEVFETITSLNTFPKQYMEYRVMPEIINTFNTTVNNENNIQSILLFMMYNLVNKSSNKPELFSKYFKNVFFKAFTFADRSVRFVLLKALPNLVDYLSKNEVQEKIFPNLITGFSDTDPTVKTETLLAVIPIADKISDRQLNNELLRFLAKLLADSNSEMRTNTIISLTKLAAKMHPNTRSGVLITAFGKSLKDPFVPARLNTIVGFKECIDYFNPEVCCSKVLSALAPALLDKSSSVRKEAEKTFELYMEKIKIEADGLPEDDAETIAQEKQEANNFFNSISGLSIENLGLTMTSSMSAIATPSTNPASNTSLSQLGKGGSTSSFVKLEDADFDFDDNDDGWGFDEDEDDLPVPIAKPSSTTKSTIKNKPLRFGVDSKKSEANADGTKKPKGMQLPAAKSKLQLELELDEEGGWGDGW